MCTWTHVEHRIHYDPCTLILFFPLYNTTWIHSIFNPTQCSCLSKQWRQTWFECKEDGGQCWFIFMVASHHVATQVPHVTPCRGREAATTLFYSLAVCTGSSHDTHSNVDGLYILCSRFLSDTHGMRANAVFSRTLRENSRSEEMNTCWFCNNVSVFYKNLIDVYQILSNGEHKKSY